MNGTITVLSFGSSDSIYQPFSNKIETSITTGGSLKNGSITTIQPDLSDKVVGRPHQLWERDWYPSKS